MRSLAFGSILIASAYLAGCSTYSSNMRVGNDISYASISDQREAVRTVKVYDTMPSGAEVLGPVDAGRCHRSFVEESPSEAVLMNDLKIAAYTMGADGLTDVSVVKTSALTKNCWYMLDARGTAIFMPEE